MNEKKQPETEPTVETEKTEKPSRNKQVAASVAAFAVTALLSAAVSQLVDQVGEAVKNLINPNKKEN